MQSFGLNENYSSLYPQPERNKPDDSFSTIPYEKGFQLLFYIESLIGKDYMQELLRRHIKNNSLKSIEYHQFQKEFEQVVNDYFPVPITIISKMNWTAWVHEPGLPKYIKWTDFDTPELTASNALADAYIAGGGKQSPPGYTDYNNWPSNLKQIFLNRLLARFNDITVDIMTKIDNDLGVTNTLDPECKLAWYPLGLQKNYGPAKEAAHEFISSMGRMKYVSPMYQALLNSNQKEVAVQWFNENMNFYHPYLVGVLKKMLGITDKEFDEWQQFRREVEQSFKELELEQFVN